MVDMIILKALDKDGEKAFDVGDKFILMAEPLNVIAKVFGAIFESVSVEEQEKKLRSDPFRFNLVALAELLHKTIEEIEQISVSEYNEWIAYFNIKQEREEKDGS